MICARRIHSISTHLTEDGAAEPELQPPASPTESTTGNYERTRKRMEELLRKTRRKREAIQGRNTQMWKNYAKANDRNVYQRSQAALKADFKPLISFPASAGKYAVNYGRRSTISHWSRGQNPLAFSSGYNNYAPRNTLPESTMHWSQLRTNAMGVGIGY